MKYGPNIHCRIKSFTIEEGDLLLSEANILQFITMINYVVKVVFYSVCDTFHIQVTIGCFCFFITPYLSMKLIPLTMHMFMMLPLN